VRVAVAILFLVSVVAAAAVGGHQPASRSAATAALAPSTTLPPPSTTTTTTPAPTTTAPPTTLPPVKPAADSARVVVSPQGVILPVQSHDAAGWHVETPCSNSVVVANGTPVGPVQVVLDPGHGGPESGAVAPNNGLTETVLNMAVARFAKAALEKAGVTVMLTRNGEYRQTLQDRADIALAEHPLAFVSIHHNAEPDGPFPRPGSETYYQIGNASSKRLAGLIYEEVVKALAQYQLSWVADTDAGAKYRPGDHGDYYAVLRLTKGVTAALAELSYITDPAEAALLIRPDVQQVEGQAVARGIIRYLTTKDPGSGFTTPYPRTEPAGGGGGPEHCTDPAL
jgi:N-acetylmuramoyl-L-alanine amidase